MVGSAVRSIKFPDMLCMERFVAGTQKATVQWSRKSTARQPPIVFLVPVYVVSFVIGNGGS